VTSPREATQGIANRGLQPAPAVVLNPFPEEDYLQVLEGFIRQVLGLRNTTIQQKARAHFNARIANRSLSVVPGSHEWSGLTERLLFLRYYVEALHEAFGPGATDKQLLDVVMQEEIRYEQDRNVHYSAYQEMTARVYGPRLRAPDPLPKVPDPPMDEETRAIIEKNGVNQKLQAFIQSLNQPSEEKNKAYATLVLAYIDTLTDLSIPVFLEYEDQADRARRHSWLEWLQANDFPHQYDHLFPVLHKLLNQARAFVKNKQFDDGLRQLETAQSLFDYLATLLHSYYTAKVRKGSRVIIVLMVLKSLSRMVLSIVVFRNVKGLVAQFGALIAVNLAYQKLDQAIGVRARGLSGTEATKDAAFELLMLKITGKISELLAIRFNIDPRSISGHTLNILTGAVVSSLQEELMKLGNGVSFVGFLKNLREQLTDPKFWFENIVMAVLAKNYTTKGTVSLPTERIARAGQGLTRFGQKYVAPLAFVGALTAAPKASADTGMNKPTAADVAKPDGAATSTGAPSNLPAAKATTSAKATSDSKIQAEKTSAMQKASALDGKPTQEQRGLEPSRMSPAQAPSRHGGNPPGPLDAVVLGLAAVVASKKSKHKQVLTLFKDARKLLDKLQDQVVRQECEQRLDDLRKAYDKNGDADDTKNKIQAVRNRINEKYAEERIDFLFMTNLPAYGIKKVLRRRTIPRRGTDGPDIIDMVFDVVLTNGKVGQIVFEAKYGSSKLGWVNFKNTQVRQFSPEWFEMRIEEIRAAGHTALADELASNWKKGLIIPFLMKISSDGAPKGFFDFRIEWNKYISKKKN